MVEIFDTFLYGACMVHLLLTANEVVTLRKVTAHYDWVAGTHVPMLKSKKMTKYKYCSCLDVT